MMGKRMEEGVNDVKRMEEGVNDGKEDGGRCE